MFEYSGGGESGDAVEKVRKNGGHVGFLSKTGKGHEFVGFESPFWDLGGVILSEGGGDVGLEDRDAFGAKEGVEVFRAEAEDA